MLLNWSGNQYKPTRGVGQLAPQAKPVSFWIALRNQNTQSLGSFWSYHSDVENNVDIFPANLTYIKVIDFVSVCQNYLETLLLKTAQNSKYKF